MNIKKYPSKDQLTIPNDWGLSLAQTNEGPMVMKVNSGYSRLIGHPEYPYQIGVAVPLNAPNSAGMHGEEEGEQVGVIEDMLVESLESDKLALYVFSQCSSGAKEWVFYTGNPDEVEGRIHSVRSRITTHTIQNVRQEDPGWDVYQNFTGTTPEESTSKPWWKFW